MVSSASVDHGPLGLHVGGCLPSLYVRGGGLLRGVCLHFGTYSFRTAPISVSHRF